MKFLFAIAILAGGIFAQSEECKLPLDKAPTIGNMRLGMSVQAARLAADSPHIVPRPVETGSDTFYPLQSGETSPRERKFVVGVEEYQVLRRSLMFPKKLTNVDGIALEFYGGALYKIRVMNEDQNFRWRDMTDITEYVADSLGLSGYKWSVTNWTAELHCESFAVSAFTNTGNEVAIVLVDVAKVQEIRDKVKKTMLREDLVLNGTDEEKKNAFKP